jgi:hypothetical protein
MSPPAQDEVKPELPRLQLTLDAGFGHYAPRKVTAEKAAIRSNNPETESSRDLLLQKTESLELVP